MGEMQKTFEQGRDYYFGLLRGRLSQIGGNLERAVSS